MIKNARRRRALSVALLVLGGVLMFLAPEHIWYGLVILALGVLLEVLGVVVGHGEER